jgi:hypothetical protein
LIYIPNWLTNSIKAGSVYKFSEATFPSSDPHFFIVLNHTPATDPFIALVVASSQVEKVRSRNAHLSAETMVIIRNTEYVYFTKDRSIIDCNEVSQRSINELEFMNKVGKLEIKADMDIPLIIKLRVSVRLSKKVEEEVKDLFLAC